jgi:hypothetical protein
MSTRKPAKGARNAAKGKHSTDDSRALKDLEPRREAAENTRGGRAGIDALVAITQIKASDASESKPVKR